MNTTPKPTVPITNPTFVYTNSAKTDIRVLFAKVRAEQAKALKPWKSVNP
jgi:hypothetical protein